MGADVEKLVTEIVVSCVFNLFIVIHFNYDFCIKNIPVFLNNSAAINKNLIIVEKHYNHHLWLSRTLIISYYHWYAWDDFL